MQRYLTKLVRDAIFAEMSGRTAEMEREIQSLKLLMGRSLANRIREKGILDRLSDAEFSVFSQFGDDGIIQYLVHHTQPLPGRFVEFGVQDYRESNTRFLLFNDNWSGLIMDGDEMAIEAVRSEPLYWRYNLKSVGAFVTRENINELLMENGFEDEIGLLSIDIDGNDYWVWDAIDCVRPVLVVAEYNSVFGSVDAISVPYEPSFNRTAAHFSNLYWGASLKALCSLAEKKGYAFVGCNSAGNNAHFVRIDKLGKIPAVSCAEGYVESRFRESRDEDGNLSYLSGRERLQAIMHLDVFDVDRQKLVQLGDLLGAS